ncbi:MAG: hypothetical protein WBW58_02275 [Candidatus Acidiferrum sp.]
MPYEFREWKEELAPQASSGRLGGPPRKSTGIGVLDPPGPPKRPHGLLAALPASFLMRVLAGVILAGLVAILLFLLYAR